MVHVNIGRLIGGLAVEGDRIEYHRDWDPEGILQTICAFANDLENIGGGYIIVGAASREDISHADGFDVSNLPEVEAELSELCGLLEPAYSPSVSVGRYLGRDLLVIWVPRGDMRPYACPVSLECTDEREWYVRGPSGSVSADRSERFILVTRANDAPFDDRTNPEASVRDIRRVLVEEYLNRIESPLDYRSMGSTELYRELRIVRGTEDAPVNVGLMMFTDDPEEYFGGTRIEVVWIPELSGEVMEEWVYRGPLDVQIRDALARIRGTFITERVVKMPDRAESLRFFNYPYDAVRETVVNAVHHRDYRSGEPVRVYVYRDRMEVSSCPVPSDMAAGDRPSCNDRGGGCYRNGRIGDFLKELGLTGKRDTGIPTVLRTMERNGSPPPVYSTDADRTFLRVTIPIHPAFMVAPIPFGMKGTEGHRRDPKMTKALMLESLRLHGCQTGRELATSVGYRGVNNTFRRCLSELMEEGEVEYLYPYSPRDRRQRICLSRRRPRYRRLVMRSRAHGIEIYAHRHSSPCPPSSSR